MDRREAAIISAYTGVLIGKFEDMHSYIEQIMGRPVFTHELANEFVVSAIKCNSRDDFMNIVVGGE